MQNDLTIPLAGIVEESIVDGPGLRFVIFTQGCFHNCPGCQNPQTHACSGGTETPLQELVVRYTENPLLRGMTFSGGEPFLHAKKLAVLAKAIHALGGDIYTYTGYTFEELLAKQTRKNGFHDLLEETDVLIDGPYVEALRDLELRFRGSSNQRLLDRDERILLERQYTNTLSAD